MHETTAVTIIVELKVNAISQCRIQLKLQEREKNKNVKKKMRRLEHDDLGRENLLSQNSIQLFSSY